MMSKKIKPERKVCLDRLHFVGYLYTLSSTIRIAKSLTFFVFKTCYIANVESRPDGRYGREHHIKQGVGAVMIIEAVG